MKPHSLVDRVLCFVRTEWCQLAVSLVVGACLAGLLGWAIWRDIVEIWREATEHQALVLAILLPLGVAMLTIRHLIEQVWHTVRTACQLGEKCQPAFSRAGSAVSEQGKRLRTRWRWWRRHNRF